VRRYSSHKLSMINIKLFHDFKVSVSGAFTSQLLNFWNSAFVRRQVSFPNTVTICCRCLSIFS